MNSTESRISSTQAAGAHRDSSMQQSQQALVVFLENVGHIHGIPLPEWAMDGIDWFAEEYAKVMLRLYGAYRHYDKVIILEDEDATGPKLADALKSASRDHVVDVMLLVHGHNNCLVGYKGHEMVGAETFNPLIREYRKDSSLLNLRMIFGVNCFGASLAPVWLTLGAKVSNGALGINWLPEPSISVFLRDWLGGKSFSYAVQHSNRVARNWGNLIMRSPILGQEHPAIESSRQTIFGDKDITIYSV